MSKIYWVLKVSLRKTLCRKFNISKYGLIKKYGPDFTCNSQTSNGTSKSTDFFFRKPRRTPMNFRMGNFPFKDPLYVGLWTVRTVSSIGEICGVAAGGGTDVGIEMHHLKHIKTLNLKLNSFDKMLATINRKQVPLCTSCHHKVHSGDYSGLTLNNLRKKG